MEIRKIQIKPEDESRLRELLKIHEADIDSLSDEELDAAEEKTSQRLQNLLQKPAQSTSQKSVLRFRAPLKTGTMAFLAAAAVMLFMQMQTQETAPNFSNMVTKGNSKSTDISCVVSVVGDAVKEDENHRFEVPANASSYVKLDCPESVYVHVGFVTNGTLHLEMSNIEITTQQPYVLEGKEPRNFTNLAQKSGLRMLITKEPLAKMDLSEADREGFWFDEVPLTVKP